MGIKPNLALVVSGVDWAETGLAEVAGEAVVSVVLVAPGGLPAHPLRSMAPAADTEAVVKNRRRDREEKSDMKIYSC